MTYEAYIDLYGGNNYLQLRQMARGNSQFKAATASLFKAVNGEVLAVSCADCYADAALSLLKNYTKNKTKMATRYKLRTGAYILRDVRNINNSERMATRHNLTDELAMYHLYTNPSCVKYFDTLPDGWEQEVAEYGRKLDGITEEALPTEEVAEPKTKTKKATANKKAKK